MLNALVSTIAATLAHGAEPRVQPLFVSMTTAQALVRVHEDGVIGLAVCPIPRGAAPDLGFDGPNALAHCRPDRDVIPDTPEARAAFGETFEELVRTHAAEAPGPRRVLGRAAISGGAFAAGFAVTGVALTALTNYAFRIPLDVKLFNRASVAVAGALGLFVTIGQSGIGAAEVSARRAIGEVPVARANENGPVFLNVTADAFGLLHDLATRALGRVARAAAAPQG